MYKYFVLTLKNIFVTLVARDSLGDFVICMHRNVFVIVKVFVDLWPCLRHCFLFPLHLPPLFSCFPKYGVVCARSP